MILKQIKLIRLLLGPQSVGQAWSTLSIFLILIRASTVSPMSVADQGEGSGEFRTLRQT